jgi:hypothetical protein
MNKKEQEVVKTMNNIIKNKNKKVSTYSMNKLKKLTKGGGITNLTNSSLNKLNKLNNLSLMSSDEFVRLAFKPDEMSSDEMSSDEFVRLAFKPDEMLYYLNKVNKKEMLIYLSNKYKDIKLNSLVKNEVILNYLSNKFKNTNINLNNPIFEIIKNYLMSDKNLNINKELANSYYKKTKENLNIFLSNYKAELLGGGKSGATVWKLTNENDKNKQFILKYNSNAVQEEQEEQISNKIIRSNSNVSSISEGTNNLTSSTNSTRSKSSTYTQKTMKNQTNKYNSSKSYIRAVREVYLLKKYQELQESQNKKQVELITPRVYELGFLKNVECPKPTKKLQNLEFTDKSSTNNTNNTYMPFVIQEVVKGKELLNYVNNEKKWTNYASKKYLRGKTTLENIRKKRIELNDELRINILIQLADALIKFKELLKKDKSSIGCHRDMHPGNIFVERIENNGKETDDVKIKLIDFDLSITNSNNLTSNTKCTRETLASLNSGKVASYAGFTIATTIDYLGKDIYLRPFLGLTPQFIKEDIDLFQYLMYIKKFYFGMTNKVKQNQLKEVLKEVIKETKNTTENKSKLFLEKFKEKLQNLQEQKNQ